MEKTIIRNIVVIATVFVSLAYATNFITNISAQENITNQIHELVNGANSINTFYNQVEKDINEGTQEYLNNLTNSLTNPELYK